MVIMRISNKTTKNMNVHIITIITLSVRQSMLGTVTSPHYSTTYALYYQLPSIVYLSAVFLFQFIQLLIF